MTSPSSSEASSLPLIGESVRDLLRALRDRGYTSGLVTRVLGAPGIGAAAAGAPEAALWHAVHSSAEQGAKDLVIAFYLRQPCASDVFVGLIGQTLTEQLIADSCLIEAPGEDSSTATYVSALDIRPITVAAHGVEDVLIASDPDASMEDTIPGTDHVPGVGHAPLSLLNMIPPVDDHARILDLGCGSGVLSLVLAGSADDVQVVGTDISARALDFARVNGDLASGHEETVTWREGSWFEPVAGERFDMIVANPPFVIGPAQVGHVYRDSGLPLDGATSLVVENAAHHLVEGGTAHILAGWALGDMDSAASRVAGWLPSHGVRAWVVQREEVDTATYVTTWLKDESLDPRSEQGRLRTAAWMDFFADHDVTRVGLGFVHLQKIDEDAPTELTFETMDQPLPAGTYLGAEVGEFFARAEWLADKGAEEILSSRYAVRPTSALERVSLPSSDDASSHGFKDYVQRLTRTDGPAWSHEVDEPLISVLSGLHPSALALEDVAELYCAVNGLDSEEFVEALVPIIVDLVRHGMIIPAELNSEGEQ